LNKDVADLCTTILENADEESKKKDPADVLQTLPKELGNALKRRDTKGVNEALDKTDPTGKYLKDCIAAGLVEKRSG